LDVVNLRSIRHQLDRLAARIPAPTTSDDITTPELRGGLCKLLDIPDLSVATLHERLNAPLSELQTLALRQILDFLEPLEAAKCEAERDPSAVDFKAELEAEEGKQ
jgi:hypothetical protein